MTKIVKNLSERNIIKPLMIALIFSVLFVAGFYFYFVGVTIYNALSSKQNLQKFKAANQECQRLEKQYFELLGKFDLDYAKSIGFVEADKKMEYVTRQSVVVKR